MPGAALRFPVVVEPSTLSGIPTRLHTRILAGVHLSCGIKLLHSNLKNEVNEKLYFYTI
jgi:hypothetical protein